MVYQFKRRPGELPGKCMLSKRKRSRIEKRIYRLCSCLIDFLLELNDQRFPEESPLREHLASLECDALTFYANFASEVPSDE